MSEVAAGIGGLPGPGCIKGGAAMTADIGDGADDGDCVSAVITCSNTQDCEQGAPGAF